jgi:hypothetical protein
MELLGSGQLILADFVLMRKLQLIQTLFLNMRSVGWLYSIILSFASIPHFASLLAGFISSLPQLACNVIVVFPIFCEVCHILLHVPYL